METPKKLLEYNRSGLIEEEHYGFIKAFVDGEYFTIGKDNDYPIFMRSCAKPLQSSLLYDFGLEKELTSEEIAICCASHWGEPCHIDVLKELQSKYGITPSMLTCTASNPVSQKAKDSLIKEGISPSTLHNNCSGKHTLMLIMCQKAGWSVKDYEDFNHPLQKAVKEKIYELCEINENLPATNDGCGVPIYSAPLKNFLKGYINLFCNEKYFQIRDAFLKNPYLIGGEKSIDTAIMTDNSHLIAKVGASGLCVVLNLENKSAFVVKMSDTDRRARAIVVIKALRDLKWIKNETELIDKLYETDILTLSGKKVGSVQPCFELSSINAKLLVQ